MQFKKVLPSDIEKVDDNQRDRKYVIGLISITNGV